MPQLNDMIDGLTMVAHTHEHILWPQKWAQLVLPAGLTWTVVPFRATSAPAIATVPGVYAFIIRPQTPLTLSTSYLMYIGKTDRALRARFREYLREQTSDAIRPKLLRILPLYGDHLFFAFSPTPTGATPQVVEQALLTAFIPPGNDRIDAQVNRIGKAF